MEPNEQAPEGTTADQALTKAERKRLKRAEKEIRRDQEARQRTTKRWFKRGVWLLIVLGVIGFFAWKVASAPKRAEGDVVSRREVHWHAKLNITIKGEAVAIPANIGIPVGVPNAHPENMHTHAEDHVIHIEKLPPVYTDDLQLGNFFQVWGKQFNAQCIMDSCTTNGGTLKMLVNDQENTQFEHYLLQDGDRVDIMFE